MVAAPKETSKNNVLTDQSQPSSHGHSKAGFLMLTLGSVGVVYGDIGTSPLYAFREALKATSAGGTTSDEIIGVVSLALWALILIVSIKYVFILMFADNKGEGGVLALQALAAKALGRSSMFLLVLGVIGAALFNGDAIITPAISVLSALEGMKTIPALEPLISLNVILILSAIIMVALFAVQFKGTAKVAVFFGPICLVWFLSMGALGVLHLSDNWSVLNAINPYWAGKFLASHGLIGFIVLGAVFLTVTGAEALYADMGHLVGAQFRPLGMWLCFHVLR
jgi:KUP system potassium uptake protein